MTHKVPKQDVNNSSDPVFCIVYIFVTILKYEGNLHLSETKMSYEEILKENGNKRWDVCLMNPPYAGRTGLHLKFLNKVSEISNQICSIQPATWVITKSSGGFMKSIYDKSKSIVSNYKSIIEILDDDTKKQFQGVSLEGEISINYIDLRKNVKDEDNHIQIINKNHDIYKFSTFNDILITNNAYLEEFYKKILDYSNKHELFYKNVRYNIRKVRDRDKKGLIKNGAINLNVQDDDLVIPIVRELAIFNYNFINKNIDKPIKYKDLNLTCYVEVTEDNYKNIIEYLKSDFAKLCLYTSLKFTAKGYTYLPKINFSKSYTDEELFNMIGMEYNKEEIDKLLNEK